MDYPWIRRILLVTKWHAFCVEMISTRPASMVVLVCVDINQDHQDLDLQIVFFPTVPGDSLFFSHECTFFLIRSLVTQQQRKSIWKLQNEGPNILPHLDAAVSHRCSFCFAVALGKPTIFLLCKNNLCSGFTRNKLIIEPMRKQWITNESRQ